jgi:hypothetical protein
MARIFVFVFSVACKLNANLELRYPKLNIMNTYEGLESNSRAD